MLQFIISILFLISCMLSTLLIILLFKIIKEEKDMEGFEDEHKK